MADTRRSLNQLLTQLFQDGQTEGISAQDIRDLVMSVQPAHADCYVTTPEATTIGAGSTFVKAEGVTTFHADSVDFDAGGASNRLRYTGLVESHISISAHMSFTSNQNNRVIGVKVYVYDASAGTGSVIDKGYVRQTMGSGTGVVTLGLNTDIHLDTNDYVEVWVTDETGTAELTMGQMYISAIGLLV